MSANIECVILWRNTQNGRVGYIHDGSEFEEIAVFPNEDAAIDLATKHALLQAFPYQIVPLEDL